MDLIKRQHFSDFNAHSKACEGNYWRLLKLMPNSEKANQWVYIFGEQASLYLKLQIIQRDKYTQSVLVSYSKNSELIGLKSEQALSDATETSAEKLGVVMLAVRVYQDAQTAEVVDNATFKQLAGHYRYPNANMYQADEKLQRNLFLEQLLVLCLKTGMVTENVVDQFVEQIQV